MTSTTNQTPQQKILLIDDDVILLRLIEFIFSQSGYQVVIATNGREALRQLQACRPDLVILDLIMPEVDGWQVCRQIRHCSEVPILMLTALGGTDNIVRGLEMGADDYLEKPFEMRILLARVQALMRRMRLSVIPPPTYIYDDGYLAIELVTRRVLVNGQLIQLSPVEYRLLSYLVQQANQVLSSAVLLQAVWELEDQDHLYLVHLAIGRLRRKLRESALRPRYVLTEHGLGYRFKSHTLP